MCKPVESISEYIEKIKIIIESKKTCLFRGETEEWGETACQPVIFRKSYLLMNDFFEKNLLDDMTAKKISEGSSYIEKAIHSQHEGFPSRFLDLSFNCLVALYFATTPYYIKDEDSSDDKNGVVFVIEANELFCPSSSGIQDNYEEILTKKDKWYTESSLFNRNFKFIDHVKLNPRIIAQQGAFILFPGNEPEKIPEDRITKIVINKDAKKGIRKELHLLFGIDTSSMYPEHSNSVSEIIEKSKITNNKEFCLETELELTLISLEKDILDGMSTTDIASPMKQVELMKQIRKTESQILWYKKNYIVFESKYNQKENDFLLKNFKNEFNKKIDDFYEYCRAFGIENERLSIDELKLL